MFTFKRIVKTKSMIRKLLLVFLFICLCFMSACSEVIPTSVYFKNLTSAGSTNYTFSVIHLQDKTMQNFYTDIFIKTDKNDVTFFIKLEGKDSEELHITESHTWQSLTQLFNNQTETKVSFQKYKDSHSKTFIITCNKNVNFTIKGVIGDLNDSGSALINLHDSSKEFKLSVKKSLN